jgi:hypothetical protein
VRARRTYARTCYTARVRARIRPVVRLDGLRREWDICQERWLRPDQSVTTISAARSSRLVSATAMSSLSPQAYAMPTADMHTCPSATPHQRHSRNRHTHTQTQTYLCLPHLSAILTLTPPPTVSSHPSPVDTSPSASIALNVIVTVCTSPSRFVAAASPAPAGGSFELARLEPEGGQV